jgi:hypothetical protein
LRLHGEDAGGDVRDVRLLGGKLALEIHRVRHPVSAGSAPRAETGSGGARAEAGVRPRASIPCRKWAQYTPPVPRPPATWCQVLEAEFNALHGAPAFVDSGPEDSDARLHALHARIHKRGTSALCLSGGGIRSATFALGVLQGLARVGVLGSIDYLSTVSGGGYIGGWFTAWLHREEAAGRAGVLDALDPTHRAHSDECRLLPDAPVSPIDRVRQTCRYLAPSGGIVSADVWTLVATLARNLVLNWLVILPLLAASLTILRIYYVGLLKVERPLESGPCLVTGDAAWWSIMGAIAGFSISTGYVVLNFVGFGARWSQQRFLAWFLTPAVAGAVALSFFWSAYPCQINLQESVLLSAVIPAIGWIALGGLARAVVRARHGDGATLRIRVGMRTIAAALVSGPVIGVGIWYLCTFEYGFGAGDHLQSLYAVFGVPVVLGLGLLQMMVFVGIGSSELDDAVLEWWSRCAAWLAIAAMVWMAGGILIFYLADLIELLVQTVSRVLAVDRKPASAIVTVLVPLLSSLAGIASRAGGQSGTPSALRAAFQKLALPLFIVVLLATIAWADLRLTEAIGGRPLVLGLALAALGLTMSAFVPVNRFSLHGMYQQRLIRTFLGASRRNREPNAFTGFDRNDDVRVHQLKDVRPLHVINTTLNAVSSTHLGRQEVMAQSFTFTPLYVGNRDLGYRPAHEYGSDGGAKATGLSLGMALAVSGAAASPAMGMYSTKSRAFLLTLANARLGLWFGNPDSAKRWQSSEPTFSVGPLTRELLGLTTDRNPYVYLSDGGHYENLGLWEMVSRRCRFIIVSDAGCDPTYTFDDLGNAVRRIRLDLGIPILFSNLDITRAGQGTTNPHAAIGRILYSVIDGPDAPEGTILYIKATLSGNEPVDVRNFALSDTSFPHDSTADQFFDEARFESYRTLGYNSVLSITSGRPAFSTVEGLCQAAREALAMPRPVQRV